MTTLAPPITRDGPEIRATILDSPGLRMLYSAQNHLDEAAERLDLNPNIYRVLRVCERSLTVSLPIETDEGEIEVYTGYRVQHTSARGPCKGGVRYHADVTGMVFTVFTICITVAEAALGLAIVILLFRIRRTVMADHLDLLKG